MEICHRSECTGCKVCAAQCSAKAITFKNDQKGFWYPEISASCINCGACKRVCPSAAGYKGNEGVLNVYAAFTKDKAVRRQSSSGGIFTELARNVLQNGGAVFATRMSDGQRSALYAKCENEDDLKAFRGSKYLQSDAGDIYREVKRELETGRQVLFIGVPCIVAALKNYLGRDYENLLTADIICHGVPSPAIWQDYLKLLEEKAGARAADVSFRYKKPSWTRFSLKVDFDNKKHISISKFRDPYLIAFLKEISMRENCYSCKYTNTNRAGDITLADFWGYRSHEFRLRNTEKGISLVLINSARGRAAFETIKPRIKYGERTLKEAMGGNRSLYRPWDKNPVSDAFWEGYCAGEPLGVMFQKYCKPYKPSIKMRVDWALADHMYLIPKKLLKLRKSLKK